MLHDVAIDLFTVSDAILSGHLGLRRLERVFFVAVVFVKR